MRVLTFLAVGIVCSTQSVALAQCVDGRDYQTVDYFAPPPSQYALYADQGGYHNSLCNTPHVLGPNGGNPGPCTRIDLKGYLYMPATIIGDVSGSGPVATGLPLIVFVEGSFANPDTAHPEIPNPNPYPHSCAMGQYFSSRGYAFLAIVRRGYLPSTGTNEIVRFAPANDSATGRTIHKRTLDYLANESFEVQEAINYMLGLNSASGDPVIDHQKVGVMGHSYGGLVTLFYGSADNFAPLVDAGNPFPFAVFPQAKTIIAAASESWDAYDLEDFGALDDESPSIRQLQRAAGGSLFPTYILEPRNDVSTRPTTVLTRAMANFQLAANRNCRLQIYGETRPYPRPDGAIDAESEIALKCSEANGKLAGLEYQAAIFPSVDVVALGYPKIQSAHTVFVLDARQVVIWGPSVEEFFGRYGVKP